MQSRAKQMILIISKICLTNFSHSVHNTSQPLYAKPCNWRYSKKKSLDYIQPGNLRKDQ